MEVAVLGIDLGKNVCSLTGFDGGKVTLRRRMKRDRLPALAERLPPCVVAMEACCGGFSLLGGMR
jgi:transposase